METSQSAVGLQHQSLRSSHELNISPDLNMSSKAFVRTTRPSSYALRSPNTTCTPVKLLDLPAVPRTRNSIAQGPFGAIIQLQPLPTVG